jgi:hypothetical protein
VAVAKVAARSASACGWYQDSPKAALSLVGVFDLGAGVIAQNSRLTFATATNVTLSGFSKESQGKGG